MIRIYLDCLGLFHQFRKSLSYCSVGGGTICRLSVPALLGGGGIICLVNVVHGLEGDKSLYPIADRRLSVPVLLGGGGMICLVNAVYGLEGDKSVKWLVGQSLCPIAALLNG